MNTFVLVLCPKLFKGAAQGTFAKEKQLIETLIDPAVRSQVIAVASGGEFSSVWRNPGPDRKRDWLRKVAD